ncbi:Cold-responsive protein kinase 1 [Linum grandiflorum]
MKSCLSSFCKKKGTTPQLENSRTIDESISDIHNVRLYKYKKLQVATGNFHRSSKIGEGGFGCVYKGTLEDGTVAAIKVLSAESRQGTREFLTEIQVIANLDHENLVKLYGCCVEANHRILVYGYLDNNSLAHTLLGKINYLLIMLFIPNFCFVNSTKFSILPHIRWKTWERRTQLACKAENMLWSSRRASIPSRGSPAPYCAQGYQSKQHTARYGALTKNIRLRPCKAFPVTPDTY